MSEHRRGRPRPGRRVLRRRRRRGPRRGDGPVVRRLRPSQRRLRRLRRRLRRRTTVLRQNRSWRVGFLVAGVLAVFGVVWIVVTGILARSQLTDFESRLTLVKTLVSQGRVDDARTAARDLPDMAQRADRLTSGPAWWVAAHVPVVGGPFDVARTSTEVTRDLGAEAIPDLLDVAALVDPRAVRTDGDTIALPPLQKAAPKLAQVADTLARADGLMAGVESTWSGPLDSSRVALQAQIGVVRGYVDAAARVTKALPLMMGADGTTRRYFIGLQNEAELRGTGGLPGAFAIASVTSGRITFEKFLSDAALLPEPTQRVPTGLDFGASYNALYGGSAPTSSFQSSNVSPNFPYAARIWAAMYEKRFKTRIDGAIAVDPTALSYFLAATGPARLAGTTNDITAANVVSLTQRDNYAVFTDNKARREFLVEVLKSASTKLTSGDGSAYDVLRAASEAGAQRRLLAWSSDPAAQRLIEQTTFAGDVGKNADRPFSAVILNNAAAGKLDFYLRRAVAYTRTGCGPRRDVLVSVTLTNTAPATGLPPYVTTRLDDDRPAGVKPGDNRSLLDYYATGGAELLNVTLDGKATTAAVSRIQGRTVFRLDLEIPRGQSRAVVFHLSEPAAKGRVEFWTQPGVTEPVTDILDQRC